MDKTGELSRCNYCGSQYYWVNSCPDTHTNLD